jgi:hypothetical protein
MYYVMVVIGYVPKLRIVIGGAQKFVLVNIAKGFVHMKYNLRFFLDYGQDREELFCFATVKSRHIPIDNSLVYLGDETINTKHESNAESGNVYKVKEVVLVYNDYGEEDDLTSVEITVVKVR